jgi:hypothetical protein
VSALEAVYPTAATVSLAESATTTEVSMRTTTGERNPNVTGGAGGLKRGIVKEGSLAILFAAMALL